MTGMGVNYSLKKFIVPDPDLLLSVLLWPMLFCSIICWSDIYLLIIKVKKYN